MNRINYGKFSHPPSVQEQGEQVVRSWEFRADRIVLFYDQFSKPRFLFCPDGYQVNPFWIGCHVDLSGLGG